MADRILVVDEDSTHSGALAAALRDLGCHVEFITNTQRALAKARSEGFHAALVSVDLAERAGMALCTELAALQPAVPVLATSRQATLDAVTSALRAGATDFICHPVESRELTVRLTRALRYGALHAEVMRLRTSPAAAEGSRLRGKSAAMRGLRELITRVAGSETTLLVEGETGTGKELVARVLHADSPRAHGAFVAINCASIPEGLLESELFGHVQGAFTDAKTNRAGVFVQAQGGTLFLDEIGDMPLPMQSKLLRVLQERTVRPVGSDREVEVDARIIAATHRRLDEEVRAGRFREDLLYRLNVLRLELPPLRERREDILELATHFLHVACARDNRPTPQLTVPVAQRLLEHGFPGNVRELENGMERVAAVSHFADILVEDLPESWRNKELRDGWLEELPTIESLQREHVQRVFAAVGGNKAHAARLLGVDRRTISRLAGGGSASTIPPGADSSSSGAAGTEPSAT